MAVSNASRIEATFFVTEHRLSSALFSREQLIDRLAKALDGAFAQGKYEQGRETVERMTEDVATLKQDAESLESKLTET